MITKQLIETEIDVKTIRIDIEPRYVGDSIDDDVPTDMPLLDGVEGEIWVAYVDVDTGKISNWPDGEQRRLQAKVCDAGIYTLLDRDNVEIAKINGYVPNGIVPGEYGDYIDLKICQNGVIENWPKNPNVDEFFNQEN